MVTLEVCLLCIVYCTLDSGIESNISGENMKDNNLVMKEDQLKTTNQP